jgi:hypothetical protein
MTLLFSSHNERPPANKSFVQLKFIGSHRMESAAACGEALAILSEK